MKASIFALFLVACGSNQEPSSPGQQQQQTTEINGKPAADFYAQFQWEKTESAMSGAGAFAKQADGKNMYLLSFYLRQSGDFVLYYEEGEGEVTFSGHSGNFDPATAKKVSGKYSVSGANLLLGTAVTCSYNGSVNGKETLDCEVKEKLFSSAAVGTGSTVKQGFKSAPTDSQWADYK